MMISFINKTWKLGNLYYTMKNVYKSMTDFYIPIRLNRKIFASFLLER